MDKGQIRPENSKILEELYSRRSDDKANLTEKSVEDPSKPVEELPQILLTPAMVDEVVKEFDLGEQAGNDLRRAIQQTEARLKGVSKAELEKQGIE